MHALTTASRALCWLVTGVLPTSTVLAAARLSCLRKTVWRLCIVCAVQELQAFRAALGRRRSWLEGLAAKASAVTFSVDAGEPSANKHGSLPHVLGEHLHSQLPLAPLSDRLGVVCCQQWLCFSGLAVLFTLCFMLQCPE
jgi:hypothetical protein